MGIDLTLEGPTPWHAHGTALDLAACSSPSQSPIDVTWGDDRDTTLPPVAVLPILAAELGKRSNWKALLPPGPGLLVSLRDARPRAKPPSCCIRSVRCRSASAPSRSTSRSTRSAARSPATPTSSRSASPPPAWPRRATCRNRSRRRSSRTPSDADQALRAGLRAAGQRDRARRRGRGASGTGEALTRNVRYDLDHDRRRAANRSGPASSPTRPACSSTGSAAASVARSPLSSRTETLTHPYDGTGHGVRRAFAVAHQADNTLFAPSRRRSPASRGRPGYMDRAVAADPGLPARCTSCPSSRWPA